MLSPGRLTVLPDVPLAIDVRADESAATAKIEGGAGNEDGEASEASEAAHAANASYVLLMHCGKLNLALPSTVVHSTVANPEVRASALAADYCLGVIEVSDRQIAAIDLAALCGMGAGQQQGQRQAFVVAFDEGLLAFLVDEIADVAAFNPKTVLPLPRTALPRPEFFCGALPERAVQSARAGSSPEADGFYLLLDGQLLRTLPELVRYASLNTVSGSTPVVARSPLAAGAADAAGAAGTAGPAGRSRAALEGMPGKVLTYDLGGAQAATPLEHISEIVPWRENIQLFDGHGAALGLLINRDRAIPTYNLGALLGRGRFTPAASSSVLVIERQQEAVGFVVPALVGIDDVDWMHPGELQAFLARSQSSEPGTGLTGCWSRIMVSDTDGQRMLALLDLRHLAKGLLAEQTLAQAS